MSRFALAGVIAVASLASVTGCTIAAPDEEPEQQRLLGSEPVARPARRRSRESNVACCVGGERFECPDENPDENPEANPDANPEANPDANPDENPCHGGFDERACVDACADQACVIGCAEEASQHVPSSTCTKVGPCR
jgi:hypothetical protein